MADKISAVGSPGWVAVGVAACALLVSLASLRTARRAGREAGSWVKVDRDVWFAEDPEVLAVQLRNAGRVEARITDAHVTFGRHSRRLWTSYDLPSALVLPAGRAEIVALPHRMQGRDSAEIPDYGRLARLTIELETGRKVRRIVRLISY